jgi:hypothetical protein
MPIGKVLAVVDATGVGVVTQNLHFERRIEDLAEFGTEEVVLDIAVESHPGGGVDGDETT